MAKERDADPGGGGRGGLGGGDDVGPRAAGGDGAAACGVPGTPALSHGVLVSLDHHPETQRFIEFLGVRLRRHAISAESHRIHSNVPCCPSSPRPTRCLCA